MSLLAACEVRPVQASPTQQRDDATAVAVAVPHPEVLRVLVAVDHHAAKLAVEEDAEAMPRDRGHRAEPLVPHDDCLRFRDGDRTHLRRADVDVAIDVRGFRRQALPHEPLVRLLGCRGGGLARSIAALATAGRAVNRIRTPTDHEALAAGSALVLARQGTRGAGAAMPVRSAAGVRAVSRVGSRSPRERARAACAATHFHAGFP